MLARPGSGRGFRRLWLPLRANSQTVLVPTKKFIPWLKNDPIPGGKPGTRRAIGRPVGGPSFFLFFN